MITSTQTPAPLLRGVGVIVMEPYPSGNIWPVSVDSMTKEVVFKDTVAKVGEHFGDYVLIVRLRGGLRWRYSDRTFAAGAMARLGERISVEDEISVELENE